MGLAFRKRRGEGVAQYKEGKSVTQRRSFGR
jgi:hypothetical protein